MNVRDIFETMEYGPAPEDAAEAMAWIKSHDAKFGQFIGGAFSKPNKLFPSKNPATGKLIAKVGQATQRDVNSAVKAARAAQKAWAKDAKARARVLYALARLVQTHARLFAVLATLDNGKPLAVAKAAAASHSAISAEAELNSETTHIIPTKAGTATKIRATPNFNIN